MNVEILIDADAVARKAAEIIAAEARATVAERGRFIMAVENAACPGKRKGTLGRRARGAG
jgi:6-phosphogluconolactonase